MKTGNQRIKVDVNCFASLAIGLFIFTLHACCTKRACIGVDEIHTIDFYNFSETDLDTITVVSYGKNSNFTLPIDSAVTQASINGDHLTAYTANRMDTDFDYKIKIVSTRQAFTIAGFEIQREGCNSCFPSRPASDFYNKLNGYSLNGKQQAGDQISIYK